jgi:phasin
MIGLRRRDSRIDLLQHFLQRGFLMTNTPFNIPADFADKPVEKIREAAVQGLAQSREAFEKANAATKGALESLEASSSIVTKGLSEFNAKALEALQANLSMSLEYFSALASVKSPADAAKLPADLAKKQMEALTAQAKDLTALAQKIATESVEPLKEQFAKTVKPSA